MSTLTPFIAIVATLLLFVVVAPTARQIALRVRTSHRAAQEQAEATMLTNDLFDFLLSPTSDDSTEQAQFLFDFTPSDKQRGVLAEVLATIADNFSECRYERLHLLSRRWHLEDHLLADISAHGGATRLRAMRTLLHLRPSVASVERLTRLHPLSQAAQFELLLLHVQAKPSQAITLLDRHPYALSWEQIEQVTAALRHRLDHITTLDPQAQWSLNVEMFMLHLAATEGLYSAVEVASRLTHSPNRALRTAAFNVLLGEALFPSLGRHSNHI